MVIETAARGRAASELDGARIQANSAATEPELQWFGQDRAAPALRRASSPGDLIGELAAAPVRNGVIDADHPGRPIVKPAA